MFVLVFEENGLRTRPMPWVDCCVAASKMARKHQRCEIMPALPSVCETFIAGPAMVEEMLLKAISVNQVAIRRLQLTPVWN